MATFEHIYFFLINLSGRLDSNQFNKMLACIGFWPFPKVELKE